MSLGILSKLQGCLEHSQDVLGRHVGLDVVDLAEDETPAGGKDLDLFTHVFANLLRCRIREHVLRVSSPAPEDEVGAKLTF